MDDDAKKLLAWMRDSGRYQEWRALDRRGKPRVYRRRMCELSRSKIRVVLDMPSDRLDAALKALCEEEKVKPLGRMLPIESSQAVELWMVLA